MLRDKETEFELSKLQKKIDKKKTSVTNIYNQNTPVPSSSNTILDKPIATDMSVDNGQILVYNEENKQWEPSIISSGLSQAQILARSLGC